MHLIRGRGATVEDDRAATDAMLDRAAETGEPALRAWTPHRQVAFGPRDRHADGYEAARRAAEARGFEAVERRPGGRAVAYTGRTAAFAHAIPVEDVRSGIDARYGAAIDAVRRALGSLGVDAERGEPPNAFCPGDHSLRAGGKVVGVAQRVTAGAALVGGCVVVDGADEIAAVLDPVYRTLELPFDPDAVGSVAGAGGPADPEAVSRALESAFRDGRDTDVERL